MNGRIALLLTTYNEPSRSTMYAAVIRWWVLNTKYDIFVVDSANRSFPGESTMGNVRFLHFQQSANVRDVTVLELESLHMALRHFKFDAYDGVLKLTGKYIVPGLDGSIQNTSECMLQSHTLATREGLYQFSETFYMPTQIFESFVAFARGRRRAMEICLHEFMANKPRRVFPALRIPRKHLVNRNIGDYLETLSTPGIDARHSVKNGRVHFQSPFDDAQFTLTIHVGSTYVHDDLLRYVRVIAQMPLLAIVITSSCECGSFVSSVRSLVRCPVEHLRLRNIGMDMLPFLFAVEYARSNGMLAEFVFKLHTKGDDLWRAAMLMPLCGTVQMVRRAMQTLQTCDLVGSAAFSMAFEEGPNHLRNIDLLVRITGHAPSTKNRFIGGSIFACRSSCLSCLLSEPVLLLLAKLCTGSDWNYHVLRCGLQHVRELVDAAHTDVREQMNDFAIEHALERYVQLCCQKQEGLSCDALVLHHNDTIPNTFEQVWSRLDMHRRFLPTKKHGLATRNHFVNAIDKFSTLAHITNTALYLGLPVVSTEPKMVRKTLLLFCHFGENISKDVNILVNELQRVFEADVAFLTNLPHAPGGCTHFRSDLGQCVLNARAYIVQNQDDMLMYDRVMLVNDTLSLPEGGSLSDLREWADNTSYDFWGLCESLEVCFHVQSFFLSFDTHDAIRLFCKYYTDGFVPPEGFRKFSGARKVKTQLVSYYEVGLTTHLVQHGLHGRAYHSCQEKDCVNPSFDRNNLLIKRYPISP